MRITEHEIQEELKQMSDSKSSYMHFTEERESMGISKLDSSLHSSPFKDIQNTSERLIVDPHFHDDDDHLVDFESIDDIDTILKNHYELGGKVNTESIFALIEQVEKNNKDEDWDLHLNEPNIKIWVAVRGSSLNYKHPFTYTELRFERKHTLESVVEAFINPECIVKWNRSIKCIRLLSKF